jgi:hypothetical protein
LPASSDTIIGELTVVELDLSTPMNCNSGVLVTRIDPNAELHEKVRDKRLWLSRVDDNRG